MWMLLRIGVITLGLGAAGFVAGWAVGVAMMACLLTWGAFDTFVWDAAMLWEAGLFGGMVGAVLGPAAAWLLMRRVPLWLAVGGTAAGTIAGAVLGLAAFGFNGTIGGALLGFGATAIALRVRGPRMIAARDVPGIARARDGV